MNSVADADITFVVQGQRRDAGFADADRTARSIRRIFPRSRIVFSGWAEEGVDGVEADQIVLSDDPGALEIPTSVGILRNNLNRQVISTRNGLAAVSTPYAAKVRSDALVLGRGFVELFSAFPRRRPDARLYRERLVIPREVTRSARSLVPLAFHPSDLFQFGLTADLRDHWNVPLVDGADLAAFVSDERPGTWFRMFDNARYTSEQHIFVAGLRRKGFAGDFRHFAQVDPQTIAASECLLFNNFIPCETPQLGVSNCSGGWQTGLIRGLGYESRFS